MIGDVTQVALGGIVALMILREVFQYLSKRKANGNGSPPAKPRPETDRVKRVANGVDSVLSRLDRILERIEDLADEARSARKQSQLNGELCERIARQVEACENTLSEIDTAARRRATSPQNIT